VRTRAAEKCRRKFLRFFPGGFRDDTYLAWERDYKAAAVQTWHSALAPARFEALLTSGRCGDIAAEAVRIESQRTSCFPLRNGTARRDRRPDGARRFAEGLYSFLHGEGSAAARFTRWVASVAALPGRQTRVLTWPVVTVFGFLAQPTCHIFLKPNVTRIAAARYGVDFKYDSHPTWETYQNLLKVAAIVQADLRDLGPRDLIDIQSFLWVQGSDEYSGRTFKAAPTTRVPASAVARTHA
jgi:hypothetical protein